MIGPSDKVLEALRVLRESRQLLRILDTRQAALEQVRVELEQSISKMNALQDGVNKAIETFSEVKELHRSKRGRHK